MHYKNKLKLISNDKEDKYFDSLFDKQLRVNKERISISVKYDLIAKPYDSFVPLSILHCLG